VNNHTLYALSSGQENVMDTHEDLQEQVSNGMSELPGFLELLGSTEKQEGQ
jgi:hypothetical protein